MEINCGSVNLTMFKKSLLTCAGDEAALAAHLVSAMAKAQLVVSVLVQEYMKLLKNQPKLRGDHQHTSHPCNPVDADDGDDDDADADADEDDDDDEEEENPTDGKKTGGENGPSEGAENGAVEYGDDDDDDDDDDEDENDDGEEEGGPEEEDDEDEEEEDEEEEALQPPKKRKK